MLTEEMKRWIDRMSHEEMARAWRFTKAGDPMFQGETGDYFQARFANFGGMTAKLSKEIGWAANGDD